MESLDPTQEDELTIRSRRKGIEEANVALRRNLQSLEVAEKLAAVMVEISGEPWVGVDNGPHTGPRFEIRRAFAVGDKVSYSIGSDSYPCGVVTKVSPSGKTVTVTHNGCVDTYRRRGDSGRWGGSGGVGRFLFHGHSLHLDPHF